MEEKVILDNGSSKLTVGVDGDVVALKQVLTEIEGVENIIYLYTDELEEALKFVKEKQDSQ
ncbi:hypothetical protein [Priestia aryabhattai]|uniref:hypothetical protein n=1 Tax=Priestia aryabhattai TaxID=412384 RepID=UPI0015F480CB|nr:hypothetical protein [Priestia aryabhattai]